MAVDTKTKAKGHAQADPYMRLVKAFPLRPVRTDADLDAAVAVIDGLVDRGELAPGEQDYLDVLARLVEDYEDERDPLPAMTGVEAIRLLIAENGLSQAGLSREIGVPVATLSEILTGKRGISPKVRSALAARFRVAPGLFV